MHRILRLAVIGVFAIAALIILFLGGKGSNGLGRLASAQATPSLISPAFDQAAALAKLKERIKGREREPAETVFKNIQSPMFRGSPAARVLAVMENGYARSLGVDCTHCHVPEKWEAEDKQQKQVARDMAAMTARINGELLKSVKNLKSTTPTVNCTTCHRGEVKPALNIGAR